METIFEDEETMMAAEQSSSGISANSNSNCSASKTEKASKKPKNAIPKVKNSGIHKKPAKSDFDEFLSSMKSRLSQATSMKSNKEQLKMLEETQKLIFDRITKSADARDMEHLEKQMNKL
ncbi:NAM-associated domain-containing protein [Caenorhabditis elegans]|uniref:NAM-associated domain-containing protein n=1 Tax=Caenorhabditis elegans TaxID=6239 RepID=Q9TZ91_CAEEL|nr:NAM-associated domain-containing protein [Caenorhabditis elegans]CCD66088.1 NAM-associated domain-containing protein [Caenorhabditis elegans]|eukprot:NP_497137.1 Uncharacterized protein CELE_F54C4.4 [Caenorhabditis elegans]